MFDVLIKNGKTEREQPIEVGINGGRIAAVAPKLEGAGGHQEIDLHQQSYVTAGWIDDHVHCYEKLSLYYDDPDEDGYKAGVTTVIDADQPVRTIFGVFTTLRALKRPMFTH